MHHRIIQSTGYKTNLQKKCYGCSYGAVADINNINYFLNY